MQIYISRDGEQNGPYSIEDVNTYLKDGTLLPTDLACQEGMDEWVPVGEIPGVIVADDFDQLRENVAQANPPKLLKKLANAVGYSFLFALLTFWFSETAFRESSPDRFSQRHWTGWVDAAKGISGGMKRGGPIYKINAWVYHELELEDLFGDLTDGEGVLGGHKDWPYDRIAFGMWVLICCVSGLGFRYVLRLIRYKKGMNDDKILNSKKLKKLRKPLVVIIALMLLGIAVAEVRNASHQRIRENNDALLIAANKGDVEVVKKCLDAGANIEKELYHFSSWFAPEDWPEYDWHDWPEYVWYDRDNDPTPVILACRHGHFEVVKLLVERGAELNWDQVETPLNLAVNNGDLRLAEFLISKGAKVNSSAASPLNLAVNNGDLKLAEFLISKGSKVNTSAASPLHLAVRAPENRRELAELLLANGADINERNNQGNALTVAIRTSGNVIDVMRLLLDSGIDSKNGGLSGQSALDYALELLDYSQGLLKRSPQSELYQKEVDQMNKRVTLLREYEKNPEQ